MREQLPKGEPSSPFCSWPSSAHEDPAAAQYPPEPHIRPVSRFSPSGRTGMVCQPETRIRDRQAFREWRLLVTCRHTAQNVVHVAARTAGKSCSDPEKGNSVPFFQATIIGFAAFEQSSCTMEGVCTLRGVMGLPGCSVMDSPAGRNVL